MKQDMRLEMELMPYKGIWDANFGNVIAPIYQEIIFKGEKALPFSFNVTLDQNVLTKQYFNTTWSKTIEATVYKQNKNYGVTIKFYYEGQTNTTVEQCTGENTSMKYQYFDTKYWSCFNATS